MKQGEVEEAVRSYFTAINRRDAEALRALFTSDAELETPRGTCKSATAIADFYAETVFPAEDLNAEPGPLFFHGDQVAVEIRLRMHGQQNRLADFFTLRGGRIARLSVYLLPT